MEVKHIKLSQLWCWDASLVYAYNSIIDDFYKSVFISLNFWGNQTTRQNPVNFIKYSFDSSWLEALEQKTLVYFDSVP